MEKIKRRITILNEIFENFQQITHWLPNNIDNASKYMFKAESLIELLEVEDCGSVGGYDTDSPVINKCGFLLYDRFTALVRKYDNTKNIKKSCNFDIQDLEKYFKIISELRNN